MKSVRVRIAWAILLLGCSVHTAAADLLDDLKRDAAKIEKAIAEARRQHDQLAGGLIKSLIAMRLELLKTNEALVQQRVHAVESGAKITITTIGTAPDTARAAELEKEIRKLETRISAQQAESEKYSGGLIKMTLESSIATSRMTLEMLNMEYLKSKYGISWLPSLKDGLGKDRQSTIKGVPGADWTKQTTVTDEKGDRSESTLVPMLSRKRFQARDWRSGIYDDAIWYDISWDTPGLERPTRAVKGVLIFADLFGEARFRLLVTIDRPLKPGERFKQSGVGFRFNEFVDEHQWVRATELSNMTIRFKVQEILYLDGTREKF